MGSHFTALKPIAKGSSQIQNDFTAGKTESGPMTSHTNNVSTVFNISNPESLRNI